MSFPQLRSPFPKADHGQYVPESGGGSNYDSTLTETLTLTATKIMSEIRVLSSAITLTASKIISSSRLLSDSLTLSATITALKVVLKEISEAITITASLIRDTIHLIANSLTLTASVASIKSFLKTLTESITVSATIIRSTIKLVANSFTITDIISALKALSATFTEQIVITASFLKGVSISISETIQLIETFVGRLLGNIKASTSIKSLIMKVRSVSEKHHLSSVESRSKIGIREIKPSTSLNDKSNNLRVK